MDFFLVGLPVMLSRPVERENLQWLSPLVVEGWERFKSARVVAWLQRMGNQADPWALVLKANEDSLPYLDHYRSLQGGWNLFINQESPPNTPRVYVFEDVWYFDPPRVEDILSLAETWPVIIVTDEEGMPPDYLKPTYLMTRSMYCGFASPLSVVVWAQANLSSILANEPEFERILKGECRQDIELESYAESETSREETTPAAMGIDLVGILLTVVLFLVKILEAVRLLPTTKNEDVPDRWVPGKRRRSIGRSIE